MLDGNLEKLLTSEPIILISDKTFKDETVFLDFHKFQRCNFIKCKLHVKYGAYRFIDCDIDNCELSLEMPALGVAALLKAYYKNNPIAFQNEEQIIQ